MEREFGKLHFIPLNLYHTLGDLLDELQEFEKSKSLRMLIRDEIAKHGVGHPYYIHSNLNVVKSHIELGEWMDAQLLQEEQ